MVKTCISQFRYNAGSSHSILVHHRLLLFLPRKKDDLLLSRKILFHKKYLQECYSNIDAISINGGTVFSPLGMVALINMEVKTGP